ncbi:FecR family protein [Sphingobacterium sp. Mn56C]|uniref:FecR family protein n=1 Tax=Sphingobacterium sp. Mn56C TaxID=3395261 RepID=UPI003BD29B37
MEKLDFNEVPYHLIVEDLENTISAADKKQLERWIDASADHAQRYQEALVMLQQLELLGEYKRVSADAAWQKFQPALSPSPAIKHPVVSSPKIAVWRRWAVAAALILGLLFAALYYYHRPVATLLLTAQKQGRQITLPDGSILVLAENTVVSYNARNFRGNRKITLKQGKIFVDIKGGLKDAPFEIEAADILIKDIGTSFDVQVDSAKVEVNVATGVVEMRHPYAAEDKAKLLVNANEKGVYDRETARLHRSTIVNPNFKSWHDKRLKYTEASLAQIAADLKQIYYVDVAFADERLKSRTWGGYFDHKSVDEIVHAIAAALQLRVEKNGDRYIFSNTY